jgi:serine/threonine protein kinase
MNEKTVSLKFNAPILKYECLKCDFVRPNYTHEDFNIYNGDYEGVGACSVLVLYNIEKNIDVFYKISSDINTCINLNLPGLAKLYGIVVEKNMFCLVFERMEVILSKVVNKKSEKEKFASLIDIMEIMISLHESGLRLIDLRPSSIFLTQEGEVKLLYPLNGLENFKTNDLDDEIIHKPSDDQLRYLAPEMVLDNKAISPANDIWMLGCLFIELFSNSRVWQGCSDSEIIKNLKSFTIPKVPSDFPQLCWGVLCECLNPFSQARSDIKDILCRFYQLMGKYSHSDLQIKISSMYIL